MSFSPPRLIAIGDIHGAFYELMSLLDKLNYDNTSDTILALGDLVDRAPYSDKVVEWFRTQHNKTEGKVNSILGNHDEKHYRWWKHSLKKREHPNYKIPMRHFSIEKLKVFNSLSDEDLLWLGTRQSYVLFPEINWVCVHAGFEPFKPLEEQDPLKITHIRFLDPKTNKTVSINDNYLPPPGSVYWTDVYNLPYNVAYGHNVHSLTEPSVVISPTGQHLVGTDTGCSFGGKLTALVIPLVTSLVTPSPVYSFVQVSAQKAYSRSLIHNTRDA